MPPASKPWWQQVTALVSLSAGGAITGFSFTPKAAADLPSPTGAQIRLLAFRQAARPASSGDAVLRSAIVNVADYYLRMAKGKTPAEMEQIIWQHDSINGVDHGASCAAFASLTLELAAQVVGQQSWVTGGTSYPWPLHKWADVRVDPNPASPGITSVLQDAQAHHRWHPLGDGYQPQPGDWVLFDGHIEVVAKYGGGVLHTIGGDSMPDFSVNAHAYGDPLGAQGVAGFVNNGDLTGAGNKAPGNGAHASGGQQVLAETAPGLAAIPGVSATGLARPASSGGQAQPARRQPPRRPAGAAANSGQEGAGAGSRAAGRPRPRRTVNAAVPGTGFTAPVAMLQAASAGAAAIPGLPPAAHRLAAGAAAQPAARYSRHLPAPVTAPLTNTSAQQAFIGQVAPGAIVAQRRYGVPAAVTIAQAIDESGWGQSSLAINDHNLFGIKGTGPAGADLLPTQEFQNGRWVTSTATFRVYHNVAQSIDDHGKLLATSGYYSQSMANRQAPNAFATALTGVYATDPGYGDKLIGLMRRYNLYRYDIATPTVGRSTATPARGRSTATPAQGRSTATPAQGRSSATPAQGRSTATPPAQGRSSATPAQGRSTATPAQGRSTATPAQGRSTATPAQGRSRAAPEQAAIPGLPQAASSPPVSSSRPGTSPRTTASYKAQRITPRNARLSASRYQPDIPLAVSNAFIARARVPLTRDEPLYRDVASHRGIRWELLAACDWMQCEAQPRYSPVHGERLGTVNSDGTVYRTKSAALSQCADDLVTLAQAVYGIDLTAPGHLSVRDLANAFAAFRWGGLLRLHRTSAMEFPYSVAGLTAGHMIMRWPDIDEPKAPDKPGGRFRMSFGAVPIVLSLNYPATV